MQSNLQKVNEIINEVKKVIIGKDEVLKVIMECILAGGHILIDDIPGVGKTTMAKAFSKAMSLDEKRIQFTPDVMPSDITGFTMFDSKTNEFVYKEGAIICNMLLADEINRTSPKTQSALLEAMEENNITVDGKVYSLPKPFIVIATENPVGSIGTQMLPESQLDRFFIKVTIGYPDIANEMLLLKQKNDKKTILDINPIITSKDIINIQNEVDKVFVHDSIYEYIAVLADKTRNSEEISLGISPRGSIALCKMAKADAFLSGKDYVTPENIINVLVATWSHRIILKNMYEEKKDQEKNILLKIAKSVKVNKK